MLNKNLYEYMFKRKSTRQYNTQEVSTTTLATLHEIISHLQPLDGSIKTKFEIVSKDKVRYLGSFQAPYYILAYSEKKDHDLVNVGYMMQQLDLELSRLGLGSCWLGAPSAIFSVPDDVSGLPYVIGLAFGYSDEDIYRGVEEFNRFDKISTFIDIERVLEGARLAPSTSNSQPWFVSGSSKKYEISRKKNSLVRAPFYDRLNMIDMGIFICHLELGLIYENIDYTFSFDYEHALDGYESIGCFYIND